MFQQVKETDRKVIFIGNGGSASVASHMAIDFLNVLKIPAQTIHDPSSITCFSNDFGYENSFANSLDVLLNPGDILVAISSSGSSANIIKSAEIAKNKGASIITLSGFKPTNPLRFMGDLNYWVESHDYGIVETAHGFLLHTIVDLWDYYTKIEKEEKLEPLTFVK